MSNFRLVYKGSPFLPQVDLPPLIATIKADLSPTFEPAAAIAVHLCPIMAVYSNLLKLNGQVLSAEGVTEEDLRQLTLGYQFPLETIQASAVCRKLPPGQDRDDVYERLVTPARDFNILRIQEAIFRDLKATCNLLKIDPSGSLIFQFLKDYPFSNDEYFQNGMEIASHLYFGVAQELAKETGNDSWLKVVYDPTIT